jgi:hypothetical protein
MRSLRSSTSPSLPQLRIMTRPVAVCPIHAKTHFRDAYGPLPRALNDVQIRPTEHAEGPTNPTQTLRDRFLRCKRPGKSMGSGKKHQ